MPLSLQRVFIYILAVCGLALVMLDLLPQHGRIGHDYYHAIPRLILGAVHVWQNGFSIPHFTPSLCAGIPLAADPQSYFFSLPQWLTFFFDPYSASLFTIALFYAIGFVGAYRLCRNTLSLSAESSLVGAFLFLFNGFSFAHLLVGHLTHYPFLLFPWLIIWIIDGLRSNEVTPFLLTVISGVYCVFGGAVHVAVVLSFGVLLFLPMIRFYSKASWQKTALWLAGAISAILVLCSAKITSGYLFSTHFVTREIDTAPGNILTTWLRYFWFVPSKTPVELPFGSMTFGAWEYVGFVSKLTLAALFAWAIRWRELRYRLVLPTFAVALFVILVGWGRPLNRFLPLLSGYHNPIKIWASFTLLFVIIGAFAFERLLQGRPAKTRAAFFLLALASMMIEFNGLANFFSRPSTGLGIGVTFPYDSDRYIALKRGGQLPPVATVVSDPTLDFEGITAGFTSLKCYEPLFGYDRSGMRSTARPGPTDQVRDGAFNLNHPGCLLYPSQYQCKAWDRIPSSYQQQFDDFRSGKSVFEIPFWHRALYALNFFGIAAIIIFVIIIRMRRRRCYFIRPTI